MLGTSVRVKSMLNQSQSMSHSPDLLYIYKT